MYCWLYLFAAILLFQLWRDHDPADANELCTERLRIPGTCTPTHIPISQQHPMQGLACKQTHVPTNEIKGSGQIQRRRESQLGGVSGSVAHCMTADTSPAPHTVYSTSLDGGPEDTACQSGDSAFSGIRSSCQYTLTFRRKSNHLSHENFMWTMG